jgi:hypothetical protein
VSSHRPVGTGSAALPAPSGVAGRTVSPSGQRRWPARAITDRTAGAGFASAAASVGPTAVVVSTPSLVAMSQQAGATVW